jgi:hypothetical protein
MTSTRPLSLQVVDSSNAAPLLKETKVLVGLDGFVDNILHVVKTRESALKYTRVERMGEFAEKIAAAAGLSANMEGGSDAKARRQRPDHGQCTGRLRK